MKTHYKTYYIKNSKYHNIFITYNSFYFIQAVRQKRQFINRYIGQIHHNNSSKCNWSNINNSRFNVKFHFYYSYSIDNKP